MLDRYVTAVVGRLSNIIAAVGSRRADLEQQRSTDRYAQSYLGTALKHPEGHTTPLRKSAERAQQEYAAVRAEWAKKGPEALALFATLMVARERRDETKAVWEQHDAAEQKRVSSKYHPEVRRLFGQLYDHGITPAMLEQLWPETIAVAADLILWQVNDPAAEDAASPLPAIFEMYADRTMEMPGSSFDATRSTVGVAPRQVKYSDPAYYRFDDIAAGLGVPPALAAADQPATDEDLANVDAATETSQSSAADPVAPAAPVEEPPVQVVQQVEREMPDLDPETAAAWARRLLATDPHVRIYWPRNHQVGDFDQDRLIPALDAEAARESAWSGVIDFLAAARAGQAHKFISDRHQDGVRWLAGDLLARKPEAIERARKAGLWGSGTGSAPS